MNNKVFDEIKEFYIQKKLDYIYTKGLENPRKKRLCRSGARGIKIPTKNIELIKTKHINVENGLSFEVEKYDAVLTNPNSNEHSYIVMFLTGAKSGVMRSYSQLDEEKKNKIKDYFVDEDEKRKVLESLGDFATIQDIGILLEVINISNYKQAKEEAKFERFIKGVSLL